MSEPGQAPIDRTGNAYCGPLVVAAIIGISAGDAAARIAAHRVKVGGSVIRGGKLKRTRARTADKLRGTYEQELFDVLADAGYACTPVDCGARYRCTRHHVLINADFTRFYHRDALFHPGELLPVSLVKRTGRPLWQVLHSLSRADTFIVNTPGHWAIARDGQWCETHTRGHWVDFRAAPSTSRQVLNVWRVDKC